MAKRFKELSEVSIGLLDTFLSYPQKPCPKGSNRPPKSNDVENRNQNCRGVGTNG